MSPIGDYESFESCVKDQQEKGKDKEAAEKICGKIEAMSKRVSK